VRALGLALALLLVPISTLAQQTALEELRRGITQANSNDRSSAKAAFLKAVALDPEFAAPRFNLALLAEQDEKWGEAARWYGEYLKYDKTSLYSEVAEKKIALMATYVAADKTPEGKKHRIWLQYIQQAQLHLAGGSAGVAAGYAELASNLAPEKFESYVLQALALMHGERYAEALTKLDAAASRASGSEKADIVALQVKCRESMAQQTKVDAADLMFKDARYAAAAAAYSELWLLLDRPEYGFLAARSLTLAHDERAALKIYDRLGAASLPMVSAKARQEKAALEARTKELLALKPTSMTKAAGVVPPEFVQASALLAKKDFYEADARLTQILEGLLPPAEYAFMFDARTQARLGMREYRGAIQDATTALLLDPSLAAAYVHRAEGHAGLGSYAEAAQDIDRAIELSANAGAKELLQATKKRYLSKAETQ
jgi:hypothetical protein